MGDLTETQTRYGAHRTGKTSILTKKSMNPKIRMKTQPKAKQIIRLKVCNLKSLIQHHVSKIL